MLFHKLERRRAARGSGTPERFHPSCPDLIRAPMPLPLSAARGVSAPRRDGCDRRPSASRPGSKQTDPPALPIQIPEETPLMSETSFAPMRGGERRHGGKGDHDSGRARIVGADACTAGDDEIAHRGPNDGAEKPGEDRKQVGVQGSPRNNPVTAPTTVPTNRTINKLADVMWHSPLDCQAVRKSADDTRRRDSP